MDLAEFALAHMTFGLRTSSTGYGAASGTITSLVAILEPASRALIIMGFGLAGAIVDRRKDVLNAS